ncbi:hypothetical protein N7470_001266 [Penicillium chermesinum]|nr:hypothetical protein N7470_001266 [Penicillium chermesinum]
MSGSQKHIVFDVVGTCVSFDAFFEGIDRVLAAELEDVMLLMSKRHHPYKETFKSLFYRVLYMAGIDNPRSFATDEERDLCQAAYSQLELRPGCREMIEKLRANGFTVWCLTTGDRERVGGYFKRAGLDMPDENLVSCHDFTQSRSSPSGTKHITKPAMETYEQMLARFAPEDQKWFAAAHMWDVSAAVKAGFRGAYCSIYEKESCIDIFNTKMDVTAAGLSELADKVIALS